MSRAPAAALTALALGCAAVVPGCGPESAAPPPCGAAMPSEAAFLADPALAPLTYHKRVPYEVRRGIGYDLWGDSRFEYRMGLEFALVPVKGARSDDDLCVQAAALRIAVPPDPGADRALLAFARISATGTGMDATSLAAKLSERFKGGAKYGFVMRQGAVTVDAGRVSHPVRGEFFVISFAWPSP